MGIAVDDGDMTWALGLAATVKRDLKRANIPVKAVNMLPEASGNLLAISTQSPYPRIAQRIMATVFANPNSQYVGTFLIVNEDVDVFNPIEVLHAWASRVHPEKDIHVYHQPGSPCTPYCSRQEKENGIAPQVVYDGTWPLDWSEVDKPKLSSFKTIYPNEIIENVLKRWEDYGFKQV